MRILFTGPDLSSVCVIQIYAEDYSELLAISLSVGVGTGLVPIDLACHLCDTRLITEWNVPDNIKSIATSSPQYLPKGETSRMCHSVSVLFLKFQYTNTIFTIFCFKSIYMTAKCLKIAESMTLRYDILLS